MRVNVYAVTFLLIGILRIGEACAQFAVSTHPSPVQAGESFRVTVSGMYLPNAIGSPRQSVVVEGSAISVFLGRACEFVCGPRTFDSVAFTVPPLAAGQYMVTIHQGERSSGSPGPADVETSVVVLGPNYRGLWWNSPAGFESGWGLSIEHQGDLLFAVWFTYDAAGNGQWLVMPRGERSANAYSGALYRTRGPAFNASPWSPAAVEVVPVGTARLAFADMANGTFTFTIGTQAQTKAITRQVFSAPVPRCVPGQ